MPAESIFAQGAIGLRKRKNACNREIQKKHIHYFGKHTRARRHTPTPLPLHTQI